MKEGEDGTDVSLSGLVDFGVLGAGEQSTL